LRGRSIGRVSLFLAENRCSSKIGGGRRVYILLQDGLLLVPRSDKGRGTSDNNLLRVGLARRLDGVVLLGASLVTLSYIIVTIAS
jgi:hypothetical protein